MFSFGPFVHRSIQLVLALLLLLIFGSVFAFAASNTVPETGLDEDTESLTAEILKPSECAAISLTDIVAGSGNLTGGGSNELMLGSSLVDTIRGNGGTDCMLAGDGGDTLRGGRGNDVLLGNAGDDDIRGNNQDDILYGGDGNDALRGGRGNDVLYGGPGDDTLNGGRGTDVCYGDVGIDTFTNCETIFDS